jgi:hypothetical protein
MAGKNIAVNLNTFLLSVLLGVFAWLGKTTLATNDSVIRLEALIANVPTRLEVETKLNEVNATIANVRTRLAEVETKLMTMQSTRPTTNQKRTP